MRSAGLAVQLLVLPVLGDAPDELVERDDVRVVQLGDLSAIIAGRESGQRGRP